MTDKKTRRSARTEIWKGRRAKVDRSPLGRFVSWHWIRPYTRGKTARATWKRREQVREFAFLQGQKRIAIYGTTRNSNGAIRRNRIEIVGSGKDLYEAVAMLHEGYIPRRPFTVKRAEDIDMDDLDRGYWIEGPEVESH
jgi:hypothetical protein